MITPQKKPKPEAKSAKEPFKANFIKPQNAQGQTLNVASTTFWDAFRQAWQNLDLDRMAMYERMDECEKGRALAARMALRRGGPAPPLQSSLPLPPPGGSVAPAADLSIVAAGSMHVGLSGPPASWMLPAEPEPGQYPVYPTISNGLEAAMGNT